MCAFTTGPSARRKSRRSSTIRTEEVLQQTFTAGAAQRPRFFLLSFERLHTNPPGDRPVAALRHRPALERASRPSAYAWRNFSSCHTLSRNLDGPVSTRRWRLGLLPRRLGSGDVGCRIRTRAALQAGFPSGG